MWYLSAARVGGRFSRHLDEMHTESVAKREDKMRFSKS